MSSSPGTTQLDSRPSSASISGSGSAAGDEIQRIPFWARRLLSNKDRDHEIAYSLQVKGATEGAIRWAIYSTVLCGIGHVYWPFFRKQTLALKGFLVSSAAMSGMVIWADYYLLRHEKYLRKADDMMRRQARKELGDRGIIATETELNKWKLEQLESLKNRTSSGSQPNNQSS